MRNAGLDEAQVGIKFAGKNMSSLHPEIKQVGENNRGSGELKSLLMKVKEES